MTVLINLLPEARMLKLKAARRRRLATSLTILTGVVAATIIVTFAILIGIEAANFETNKSQISRLKADVNTKHKLEQTAATIQEHLASFDQLNKARLSASDIFAQLVKTIPPNVSLNSFQITPDYSASVSGSADSFQTVGVFSKALEEYNVSFKHQANLDSKPVFYNVAIGGSTKDVVSGKVTFSLNFKIDKSVIEKNKALITTSNQPNQWKKIQNQP